MSDIQGKKLPKLMILAMILNGGSLLVALVGFWYWLKIIFTETITSPETISPEILKGLLTGLFFISGGLSMERSTTVLVKIADDCLDFFRLSNDKRSFSLVLLGVYGQGIFFTAVSFILLLFIKPYDDVLFTMLACFVCVNVWSLAIIFYYRNTTLQLLKQSE